ncbi:hypothetical protein B9Z55_003473 [Caenorhabditis nigoni]|uniref:Uncharacterized protein n=2 Tax=Caenorhabditis nigoni TaxID=1611254 RepID=A0A2G5VQZ4_9PELO|nr:hypothetical protein B9Z55_003473 [Caenorhabditis nigoni]
MVEEMGEWMKKLEKLHDEDIDFLKKSINDLAGNLKLEFAVKIDKTEDIDSLKKSIIDSIAKLEQKMTEKSEEGHKKLKHEFAEKMEKIEKFYQEKIDNLSRENSKILKNCQEKIDRMEKIWESKIPKLESLELAEREPRNSHFRGPHPPGNPWEQGGYNQQMGPPPPQMMQMGPPPPMMMMYHHQQWQMGPQMGQFQQFNRYYGPY